MKLNLVWEEKDVLWLSGVNLTPRTIMSWDVCRLVCHEQISRSQSLYNLIHCHVCRAYFKWATNRILNPFTVMMIKFTHICWWWTCQEDIYPGRAVPMGMEQYICRWSSLVLAQSELKIFPLDTVTCHRWYFHPLSAISGQFFTLHWRRMMLNLFLVKSQFTKLYLNFQWLAHLAEFTWKKPWNANSVEICAVFQLELLRE